MASKSTINVRILGDNSSLKGALSESSSSLKTWAGSVGKIAAAAATAAGAAVAAGITKGLLDANDAEANTDRLQASLGITPERAAELGAAASSVYRQAWGESLEGVSETVEGLSTSFENLGADEIEGLTTKAIALGDAFQQDTALGIQTASELVSSGLAGSADEAFDLLTVGLQRMPKAIRDELFAASNEYGDFFADLGFTGNEAFGLLTDFADDGVFGIDKVGDAIKELSIRATDGSTASVEAYEAIGISAGDTAAAMLEGGDDARAAFFDIVTGLQGIEDPVLQANSAIALFGTPLEDLSVSEIPEFLDSLNNIDTTMGDVRGAATEMADTLGGNNKAKIEAFKRQALGRLSDFTAKHVIPRLTELGDYLKRELPPIIERLRAWFERNWPRIQAVIAVYVDYMRNVAWPLIRRIFAAVRTAASAVVLWIEANWPKIRATVERFVNWFQTSALPVIQAVVGGIIDGARMARDWFVNNWPTIRETIANVVDWLDAHVVPVVEAVAQFIVTEFGNIKGWVDENWPKIKETIDSTVGAIKVIVEKVVAAITAFWESEGEKIVAFVTTAWQAIKDTIEGVLEVVRGIIQTVTSLIRGDWEGVWSGIKAIVDGAWQAIQGIVDAAIAQLKLALSLAWFAIEEAASFTWGLIKTAISTAIDSVVSTVTGLPGRLLDLVGSLKDAGASLGSALLDGLKDALSATAGFAGDVGRAVLDAVKGVVNRFVIDKINSALEFKIPVPFGPDISINPPNIPRLHSGGSVGNIFGPAREVPRILETGEGVLSRDDMRELVGLSQNRNQGASGPVRLIVGRHEFDAYLDDRDRELLGAA